MGPSLAGKRPTIEKKKLQFIFVFATEGRAPTTWTTKFLQGRVSTLTEVWGRLVAVPAPGRRPRGSGAVPASGGLYSPSERTPAPMPGQTSDLGF